MFVEAQAASATVKGAIHQASRLTGAGFQYLLATAQVESNFNPKAAARGSSARGLFQFVEQTWLATMKEHGAGLGYGRYAAQIQRTGEGQFDVANPRMRTAILSLRSDPTVNSVLAGAFTRDNAAKLQSAIGRKASEGELYLAHFLGAAGAARLIGMAERAPNARADAAFPTAARANPSIFYARGRPRGVAEVQNLLVRRFEMARGPAATEVAAVPQQKPQLRTGLAPDTAALTETYAAAARVSQAQARLGDNGPAFHGLFRTPAAPEAVAPVVSALWGAPQPLPEPPAPAVQVPHPVPRPAVVAEGAGESRPSPGRPLDLFHDQLPDARALFRGSV